MKWGFLLLLILGNLGSTAFSQTWEELFRQKETQKEYLVIQLGALRLQSGLLKEAGQIASTGLNSIRSFRGLEKDMHEVFFTAHRTLGPMAGQAMNQLLTGDANPDLLRSRIVKSKGFWMAESQDDLFLNWTERVHQGLIQRCDSQLAELLLISGDQIQASDAQRADWIETLRIQFMNLHRHLSQVQVSSQFRLAQTAYQDYELHHLNRF